MPNLSAKTHVADGECHCCGKPVKILLNKNGHAYYFCGWINETGNQCNGHARWGYDASQQMQRDYLDARKATKTQDKDHDKIQDAPAKVRNDEDDDGESGASGVDAGAIERANDTGSGWGLGNW